MFIQIQFQIRLLWTAAANASMSAQHRVAACDSKITRLLQDSLGGNSKTLMIANVSVLLIRAHSARQLVSRGELGQGAPQPQSHAAVESRRRGITPTTETSLLDLGSLVAL
jgi:hypothetical protein